MTGIFCSWDSLCHLCWGSPAFMCVAKPVLCVSIPATMSAGLWAAARVRFLFLGMVPTLQNPLILILSPTTGVETICVSKCSLWHDRTCLKLKDNFQTSAPYRRGFFSHRPHFSIWEFLHYAFLGEFMYYRPSSNLPNRFQGLMPSQK